MLPLPVRSIINEVIYFHLVERVTFHMYPLVLGKCWSLLQRLSNKNQQQKTHTKHLGRM